MKEKITAILFVFLVILLCGIIIFPKQFNEKTPESFPKVKESSFNLGLDLEGGAYLLYQADLEDVPIKERELAMENLRNWTEKKINLYGTTEASIRIKEDRMEVEIPGQHDLEELIKRIGKTPFLDFRETSEETEKIKEEKWKEIEEYLGKERNEVTFQDLLDVEESGEIEELEVITTPHYELTGLTGRHIENAKVIRNNLTKEPIITLEFNEEGAKLFEEITARNIGKPLATFLDGNILQKATVQEKITGGKAQISGSFSQREAYEIADNLTLPVPISIISQQSIGPELGAEVIDLAVKAGLVGAVLVSIFMILVYRLSGLVSVISLFVYALLVISLFKIIPGITLTLSGLAGFILSIGMAIDANVLVLSRMKEEMKKGNDIRKSIEESYLKAWSSIRDGNITTLIVAFVIFFITTSFVRGFAVMLILGILVSIFSVMIINRILLRFCEKTSKKIWV